MERFPDGIVSDYHLPGGHTALDVVRAAGKRFGAVPLVVFSGESMDFSEVESLTKSQVLRKPVPAQDLLVAIEAAAQAH